MKSHGWHIRRVTPIPRCAVGGNAKRGRDLKNEKRVTPVSSQFNTNQLLVFSTLYIDHTIDRKKVIISVTNHTVHPEAW